MSVSFNPIGSWFVVVVAAIVVTILTVWAYQQRLRGTTGAWRWFALGLRLAAVLLCVIASMRPSVLIDEKQKDPSSLVFLIDDSMSMTLAGGPNGQTRWASVMDALAKARPAAKELGPNVKVRYYRFNGDIRELMADDKSDPAGKQTAIGASLLEAVKRQDGTRVAAVIVLSDGANNTGWSPLDIARRLRSQDVKVSAVGVGSESAGRGTPDISVRDITAGPTVFVKNQLVVRGSLVVHGFPNQTIDVGLFVEGQKEAVAHTSLKVPEGSEVIPITGLKYVPQTPGEKMVTLKVKPRDQELLKTNNEISTFVTVLSGGLNVLFVQGRPSGWDTKYFYLSIEKSPDIQADIRYISKPAEGDRGELEDALFAPGKYNAYVLSDLAANLLTETQQRLLASAIEKGAGIIMLGGRSSFGPGGWGATPLATVLPVEVHPGDRQLDPADGLKFVPNMRTPASFIFQVGANTAESQRVWDSLPNLPGANELGRLKANSLVLAQSPGRDGEPLMVEMELKGARSLAFGGETWVWARAQDDAGLAAHRRFWRQVIFWLAHKEDEGENKVTLALDNRRISVGQKVELTATARDSKNQRIPGVKFEATVTRDANPTVSIPVPVDDEGERGRGSYLALDPQPGEYRATVRALGRDGKEIGRDTARFLVYQDDREMENPAADLDLLKKLAETTGGSYLSTEELPRYIKSLQGKVYSDHITQHEHKVWDNWPFLLLFTALLTIEWWLRKRHGWV